MSSVKIKAIIIFSGILVMCCSNPEATSSVKTEIYFGLSTSTGEPIPLEDWEVFKEKNVEEILSGYTEILGNGFWSDDEGVKHHEKSVTLIYLHENTTSENLKIDSLISLYKTEFEQHSVLKVQYPVEMEFK
ncbi:MAG: DUF3574 domain-containing protein [Balneola sp.]|nr:MAG: DUF3574 domain-containing protein [Balneola sp.]